MRRDQRTWLLTAWFVITTLLCSGNGQEISSDDFPVPTEPPQTTEEVAALNSFPYCQCSDYRCGSSPYRLTPPSVTASATTTRLCYTFSPYADMHTIGTLSTINFRVVSVAVGTQLGTPACDGADLAEIKLYVDNATVSTLAGATFNGNAILVL
ncbi:extracellular matrix glycoprotein pherophorin-V32 [Haematococcus lacustris]|uniref:Extracellular matrix glycoprotein pherophorin-V32 n=1 Tax=Haematococcus lacustris TaxID=44745 RepID=A0A699YX30_HAELA|nr:extracellular matrix glycoprotein pherophorin-V32 [Haematococcus lacustris]